MSMQIENINYSLSFREDVKLIEIKYRDSSYNQHFIIINDKDAFITKYLNRDINKLWNFLIENDKKNQILFNLDESGKYNMVINNPIYLEYPLTSIEKGNCDIRVNQLIHENNKLINTIKNLENKIISIQKNELYNHFDNLIHMTLYDLNSNDLYVNTKYTTYGREVYNINFSSLCLFPKLSSLTINWGNQNCHPQPILTYKNAQMIFEPITKINLKKLWIYHISDIIDIDFTSSIHTLEEISIQNCPGLKSIDGLFQLTNLQKVTIHNCPLLEKTNGLFLLTNLKKINITMCPLSNSDIE
jgi:hypothetical protein